MPMYIARMVKIMKGQASIIGVIIGIVTAIVGFVIVDDVVSGETWNSSLSQTVATYVVPIGLLGVLAMAAFLASGR